MVNVEDAAVVVSKEEEERGDDSSSVEVDEGVGGSVSIVAVAKLRTLIGNTNLVGVCIKEAEGAFVNGRIDLRNMAAECYGVFRKINRVVVPFSRFSRSLN